MSHKISLKEANKKYERELEIRELVKQGKYTSKRQNKLSKRIKKEMTWLDYIKRRGGLAKPKEEEKTIDNV